MENIIILIILGIAVLVFIGLGVNYLKKRSSKWNAVVVDKDFREQVRNHNNRRPMRNNGIGAAINIGPQGVSIGNNNRHVTVNYFAILKSEEGKEFKWRISEGMYEKIQIGDKVEKQSGSMTLNIIESATPNNNAQQDREV